MVRGQQGGLMWLQHLVQTAGEGMGIAVLLRRFRILGEGLLTSSLCCGVLFPFLSEDGDGMSSSDPGQCSWRRTQTKQGSDMPALTAGPVAHAMDAQSCDLWVSALPVSRSFQRDNPFFPTL